MFSTGDYKGRFPTVSKENKIRRLAKTQMWVNWQEYLQLGNWKTISTCEKIDVSDESAEANRGKM